MVVYYAPLIPTLGRQRQVDFCEFEASMVYIVSSRPARATQRDPVSKQNQSVKSINEGGEGAGDRVLDLQDYWKNEVFLHELSGFCTKRILVFSCNHENIFKCSGMALVLDHPKQELSFPPAIKLLHLLQNSEDGT